jgi:hypothetical protein
MLRTIRARGDVEDKRHQNAQPRPRTKITNTQAGAATLRILKSFRAILVQFEKELLEIKHSLESAVPEYAPSRVKRMGIPRVALLFVASIQIWLTGYRDPAFACAESSVHSETEGRLVPETWWLYRLQ